MFNRTTKKERKAQYKAQQLQMRLRRLASVQVQPADSHTTVRVLPSSILPGGRGWVGPRQPKSKH